MGSLFNAYKLAVYKKLYTCSFDLFIVNEGVVNSSLHHSLYIRIDEGEIIVTRVYFHV